MNESVSQYLFKYIDKRLKLFVSIFKGRVNMEEKNNSKNLEKKVNIEE